MKTLTLLVALVLFATTALAQTEDQKAQCQAAMSEAKSQALILRTPMVLGEVTQSPLVSSPAQTVLGGQASVQSIRKAGATMQVASSACKVYSTSEDLALKVEYLLPSLERDAVKHRLKLDQLASSALDTLIGKAGKMLDAQNITRQAMYALHADQSRVQIDLTQQETTLASMYIPVLSPAPISDLVDDARHSTMVNQRALSRLSKTSDWDIALTAGAHHSLTQSGPTQPFGGFTATWSPVSRKADRLADESIVSNVRWSDLQETGPIHLSEAVRGQIKTSIRAQVSRLVLLHQQEDVIEDNLAQVRDVLTSQALAFKNSLDADRIILEVEIRDAEYREEILREALGAEYGEEMGDNQP